MKLATLKSGRRDGRLVVVSSALTHAVDASGVAPTLLDALERWQEAEPDLRDLAEQLEAGRAPGTFAFDPQQAAAPLPRAPQWCDGSAFLSHGELMQQAFNLPPIPDVERIPLMYQGGSDDMLGPARRHRRARRGLWHRLRRRIRRHRRRRADGMPGVAGRRAHSACRADQRRQSSRLRAAGDAHGLRLLPGEALLQLRTGGGDARRTRRRVARRPCAPAVARGAEWTVVRGSERRRHALRLRRTDRSRRRDAAAHARARSSDQGRSRMPAAPTARRVWRSAAPSSRSQFGAPQTPFMRFGDRVRMEARLNGQPAFGAIDQRVVRIARPAS